jgi:CHAT domain-containing protein/tetratricopeptide (TPR) repeat protein
MVLPGVLCCAGLLGAAGASAQVVDLRPSEPRWIEGATGTTTELAFDVEADQFVHLEVRQDGTDVAVVLLDPTGAVVREADDAGVGKVIEPISWTRSRPGRHTLRVRIKSAAAPSRFEVVLDPPRPATPADEEWLRCERRFVAAQRYQERSPAQRATETYALRRLVEDFSALGDERWAALSQLLLGTDYHEGDSERGLEHCLEAADYAQRSGDATLDAAFQCASIHLNRAGFPEDAILLGRDLLTRQREAGDLTAARMSQLNLGLFLINAGRTSEAATLLSEVVQDAETSGDLVVQGFGHAHLGRLHRDRGEYQQALDHYARSVAVPHAHRLSRAAHRAAYASVQMALGDVDAASVTARRAMAEVQGSGDVNTGSLVVQVMARVHAERGAVDQAIALLSDNVALCRRKSHALLEVDGLIALGRAEAARGRRTVARRHQQDALERSRTHEYPSGEALALAALCALDDAEGVSGRACEDALSKAEAIGYGPVALLSRYYQARAARRRGELAAARTQLERALKAVDAQRLDLRRSDLRQTFSASVDDIEDEYVDLLVDLAAADPAGGWDARAFEASERSRGRSLRDELAESRLGIRQGADPALLREEDELRDRLRASLARQLRGGVSAAAAQELERTIGGLQASLADVAARIRRASPRYASISQPEPPTLAAIRGALLDDDSVLLYYALGERRSFLWVVTGTTIERHDLPSRRAIERTARPVVAALSSRAPSSRGLATLGRLLLGPAAARLDVPRVTIVADGVLHYVPFAALVSPRTREPLLRRSQVVHLPSAAAGVLLAAVPERAGAPEVAVFADPVFRADDPRVQGRLPVPSIGNTASLPRELTRDGRLERLLFTRQEARAIQALAGSAGRVALDFDASREAALDARLSSYRVVHFATHGLLNASRPELSGIVLSLVDSNGRPQDGFLTSLDTYNLRLDADLVVLSGCRTALGRDVRSEGIVGLTRGFMYAGARGVLATLWPVDDLATSELMRVFYEGLLGPRRLTPPAALREAQAHVRSRRAWSSPYYWAAFQLQGGWGARTHPRN